MEKSLNNSSWPFYLDHVNFYAYWEELFTDEECEKIISIGSNKILETASIGGKTNSTSEESIRDSKISWLTPADEMSWVYQRISDVSHLLNEKFFKFDLFGIVESMQFTKYEEPYGKYNQHTDTIFNGNVRKLSISVQLSDPDTYTGGNLNLYRDKKPTTMIKSRGSLVAFPSYTLHEITPITSGTRYSLISWITGVPFK